MVPDMEDPKVDTTEPLSNLSNAPTPQSEQTDTIASDADYQAFKKWQANRPPEPAEVNADPDVYVHLANGDVERIPTSELPAGGSNGTYGHFVKDSKVHQVIGVYPVEENAEVK
jgi:hypothetical protein